MSNELQGSEDLKNLVQEWLTTPAGKNYQKSQSGENRPQQSTQEQREEAKTFYDKHNTQDSRKDYVYSQVKKRQNEYGGDRSYQTLMAKIKDQDSTLKQMLKLMKKDQKPFSELGAKALGTTYQDQQGIYKELHKDLVEVVKDKLHVYPNKDLAQFLCKKFGVLVGTQEQVNNGKAHISYPDWEELVALDDFGTIAKTIAVPLLQQYGPRAIKYVWNKLFGDKYSSVKDSIVSLLNTDQHYSQNAGMPQSIPAAFANNVLLPQSSVTVGGVNQQNPGFESMRTSPSEYGYNAVNIDYIMTFACPEKYAYRKPTPQPSKISLAQGSIEFTVTTDTSGNAFAYIFPQLATGAGAGTTTDFAFTSNLTTAFNPPTGLYLTGSVTNIPGPLSQLTNNIEFYRLSAASLQLTPIVSANTSVGNVQMSYFQNPVNTTFNTAQPAIPQSNIANLPFYQQSNMMTSIRSVHIPDDNDNEVFGQQTQPPFTEGWYICITGATPSAIVMKFDVYYVYEFFPQSSSMPICVMDFGKPGAATLAFIANVVRLFPAIQSFTPQEVQSFCMMLRSIAANGVIEHDQLLKHIVSYSSNYRKQAYSNVIMSTQQNQQENYGSEFEI